MNQPAPAPEPGPARVLTSDTGPPEVAAAPSAAGLGPVGDLIGGDWPNQAADTVERVISNVRRKTTGPAIVASRALVYGIIAAVFGIAALVLLVVAVIRLVDVVLPTWGVHLAFGGLFSVAGIVLLRMAHRPAGNDR